MGTRWSIVGSVAGVITGAKFLVLATLAVVQPGPMERGYALALAVTLLLGITASGLLIAGWSMSWVETRNGEFTASVERRNSEFTAQVVASTEAYAEGVSDTVDRLAQALPAPPPIRRVS